MFEVGRLPHPWRFGIEVDRDTPRQYVVILASVGVMETGREALHDWPAVPVLAFWGFDGARVDPRMAGQRGHAVDADAVERGHCDQAMSQAGGIGVVVYEDSNVDGLHLSLTSSNRCQA